MTTSTPLIKRHSGYTWNESEQAWLDNDTFEFVRSQDLIPTDWPLQFGMHWIRACIDDAVDSLGTYCMGWEL